MSEHLKAFLTAWLEWVDTGAVDGEPFERRRGLCSSFEYWMDARNIDCEHQEEECDGLTRAFRAAGLNRVYPFGGAEEFYEDSDANEMHLNPARIAWVRSKVAQHEAA
ncbi:hypothetical protein [Pararobbsia alpina]|uniref:Uncharacterized protein n=1 Tax=Pararobbsia alpina TaxID=621374 RepID=A0A6S7BAK5_9BURK|nr:hypothetical protein [Pararobbsia alpina]CAB3784557.1 hypothetical protein LMG28138_01833 [Pararobbsia alpina]